jgi:predicted metal-dependent peptidase
VSKRGGGQKDDPALVNFNTGYALATTHPLFGYLLRHAKVVRVKNGYCPPGGWAVVLSNGEIHVHPTRRGDPAEWAYVLAHAVLHLAFEHHHQRPRPVEWNTACCTAVARFLAGVKIGRPPEEMLYLHELPVRTEEALYRELVDEGIPDELGGRGAAGPTVADLWFSHSGPVEAESGWPGYPKGPRAWREVFAEAVRSAVGEAVRNAAGVPKEIGAVETRGTIARRWFIDHYPLLGSLALAFKIIEDPLTLHRMSISVGAVDPSVREIYLDSRRLSDAECRFVMAHELLHVGLRHAARRQGRDPFLWNVACDYVINGWLIEMGVGELPKVGALYDPECKGLSAEAVYDRVVTDLRRNRKLATLRGYGLSDLLGDGEWWSGEGSSLDDFYRRCLAQGLATHEGGVRGYLPAGLVEEIRAQAQPPIPWDVELERWFDRWFSPIEKRRTYARPSRRQSSTPDIPRPSSVVREGALDGRTFGVVLDTSGSMPARDLARALGAIVSYALSREVPAVRVVFCDADAYDQGYLPVESIAGRVRVKGRGGTVLQPAVKLLETAPDFPQKGPILIITDGECDRLQIRRDHAFLMPHGKHLPFVPKGPVFRMS